MVNFTILDVFWAVAFLLLMVGGAFLFYRLARRSESDFFLAGRGLPWWLPATSVYATHTATDTPMWITGTVYAHGLRGLWYTFFAGWTAVAAFVSARVFRRSLAYTQAEWQVVRFHGLGKLEVALGVFVGAVHQRVGGQGRQALKRGVHLLGCAFEQATAAGGEQGIATQQHARVIKRDVPQGMARHGIHVEIPAQYADAVVIVQVDVPRRDLLVGRAIDLGAGHTFDLLHAADMIMVMVGDQDIAEVPLGVLLEPGQYGSGIAGVDHGATVGMGVLQQPDVVVGEGG